MSLTYLYCVLPGEAQLNADGVAGMEEQGPVKLLPAGSLQAAVSDVGDDFAEANLNARITDLDWLSPRAVRHHEVVDELFARCKPLLPLTFGVIFRSQDSLRQRLAAQEAELLAKLDQLRGHQEWNLRLIRDQAAFSAELRRHSPELAQAEKAIQAKPPGTRFLLEKKLENLRTREAKRLAAAVRTDVHATLSALAVDAQRDDLATSALPQDVRLELRSAYLVAEPASEQLAEVARELASKYAGLGYELELTGPWAPFTFAGTREVLG